MIIEVDVAIRSNDGMGMMVVTGHMGHVFYFQFLGMA